MLTKVTRIANDLKLDDGIGTCGKAGQSVPVGVGLPTLLVSELTVGGPGVASCAASLLAMASPPPRAATRALPARKRRPRAARATPGPASPHDRAAPEWASRSSGPHVRAGGFRANEPPRTPSSLLRLGERVVAGGAMPTACEPPGAAAVNGRLYVIGGAVASGASTAVCENRPRAERLDAPRVHAAARNAWSRACTAGHILAAARRVGATRGLLSAADRWETLPPMRRRATTRGGSWATACSRWAAGLRTRSPRTRPSTPGADLDGARADPTGRSAQAAAVVRDASTSSAARATRAADGVFPQNEAYTPHDSWQSPHAHAHAAARIGAVAVGDRIFSRAWRRCPVRRHRRARGLHGARRSPANSRASVQSIDRLETLPARPPRAPSHGRRLRPRVVSHAPPEAIVCVPDPARSLDVSPEHVAIARFSPRSRSPRRRRPRRSPGTRTKRDRPDGRVAPGRQRTSHQTCSTFGPRAGRRRALRGRQGPAINGAAAPRAPRDLRRAAHRGDQSAGRTLSGRRPGPSGRRVRRRVVIMTSRRSNVVPGT